MPRFLFFLIGGCVSAAARSSAGLLSRSSSVLDPNAAWRQRFETTLDTSLTRNLQALDQLLRHSTTLGQHFENFQNAALAMARQTKNLEQTQANSHNRLNAPEFNSALVGAQNQLGKLQADMQATFHKMEQNYKTVTDRTQKTKALMDKVLHEKALADAKHKEVQDKHAEMLRDMQEEQSAFDSQMNKLQGAMGATGGVPPPTAAPPPPVATPAPGSPAPDQYEVMIDGLEQQQAELEGQMKDLDALLGSSETAFIAAVNATSSLKAENATSII